MDEVEVVEVVAMEVEAMTEATAAVTTGEALTSLEALEAAGTRGGTTRASQSIGDQAEATGTPDPPGEVPGAI